MNPRFARLPVLLSTLLLAGALAAAGCSELDVQRGTGEGAVVAVDREAGEITLDHGEVPGVMGAMQMAFPVSDPKLLEGVEPGDRVEFDVEYRNGMYTVQAIRPAGA